MTINSKREKVQRLSLRERSKFYGEEVASEMEEWTKRRELSLHSEQNVVTSEVGRK